ncbi:MAG: hypothetical protein IH594_12770 [Bacteroidales bacterium]|nr:hypothetical protein [Bacteroidales bacterium]
MKKLHLSMLLMILMAFTSVTSAEKQIKVKDKDPPQNKLHRNYNYAYSCDGYNQDRDDIAASAMTLAIFDRAGLADRIVHFHFNTNFGGKPTHAEEHRKSVLETAVLFGIIKEADGDDAFFDVSRSDNEKKEAIAHLACQIRKAGKRNPLMIFAAGGVQVPYAALKKAIDEGASKKALQNVVFLSHADANEKTRKIDNENPEYSFNWDNLKKLSAYVQFIDYTSPLVNGRREGGVNLSQNSTGWEQSPRSKCPGVAAWQWLANYGEQVEGFGFKGTKGEWLLTRLKAAGAPELGHNGNAEGDASDAGMVFSQLPGGITDATMEEIRDFFVK